MVKIGLLSDTHGHIDDRMKELLAECDEIWHAGDFGSDAVADALEAIKPLRAVYGNIDGATLRSRYKKHNRFTIEGLDVWMTHIGGYPGKYEVDVRPEIFNSPPKLFISGHSHILKVINDPKLNLLHMNPGAAGKYGFHVKRTMLFFSIGEGKISDVRVVEWNK